LDAHTEKNFGQFIFAFFDSIGQSRRLSDPAATSAITPNADIYLRCTK
jgi:hypothetical protein